MGLAPEDRDRLLQEMREAVETLEQQRVVELSNRALEMGMDAYQCINEGLSRGMQEVSRKFETHEYFVPELLRAAKAMNAGIEVLRPHVRLGAGESASKGRIVLGTVKGDIHSIGKDLVALMLEANGFEVHNLGVNVDAETFVGKADEVGADVIGLSALMTTTMLYMRKVVDLLQQRGLRDRYLVMVGGAPIGPEFAAQIGADAAASHAVEAVEKAQALMVARRQRG